MAFCSPASLPRCCPWPSGIFCFNALFAFTMSDYKVHKSGIFGEIDYFDTQEELSEYLELIKPHLANIIIEFNCLEDEITSFLCDLYGEANHENIYVILLDMMFRKKATTLFKLYKIENSKIGMGFDEELKILDREVTDCGSNRNEYAHGSWLYASPSKGVSVKVKSSSKGVRTVYRKFDHSLMQRHLNQITATRAHLLHFHKRFMAKKC